MEATNLIDWCYHDAQKLEKERAKAAAALNSLQEKAEEKLKMELEEKV